MVVVILSACKEGAMAVLTQVQLWSKERDEHGFPRKYNVYLLGRTVRIGDSYNSPLLRVRDSDYRINIPTSRIKATSEDEARAKSVDLFKQEAAKMGLDFIVTEIAEV
jgi:hypothetical protein